MHTSINLALHVNVSDTGLCRDRLSRVAKQPASPTRDFINTNPELLPRIITNLGADPEDGTPNVKSLCVCLYRKVDAIDFKHNGCQPQASIARQRSQQVIL